MFVKVLEKAIPELYAEFKMYNEMLREQDFLDPEQDHQAVFEILEGHFEKVKEISNKAEKYAN